jgi:hypothetical protein
VIKSLIVSRRLSDNTQHYIIAPIDVTVYGNFGNEGEPATGTLKSKVIARSFRKKI